MDTSLDNARLRERLIALTRDLVLIPGSEERPAELQRAIHWVRNHLESIEGVVVHLHESEGLPSLVALPDGCEHPDVLMCGHVDVVHHQDPADYRSELRDGCIHGPGTGDMKGIVAILLELFRRFHLETPGTPLGLAITTDEERGGEHGTRTLVDDFGLRCNIAMVPDGGSVDEIVVEEKGILHLHLEAAGRACHAARPWLGENALEHLMAALGAIRGLFPSADDDGHWYATCAVTRIDTPNRSINRVPSHASANLDVRFPFPATAADLLTAIRGKLPAGITVEPIIAAEPSRLSPDPAFLDACEAVLGHRPRELREHGGSDARFLARQGIPVIMSRPLCGNLHSRSEWINIDSMISFHEIYRRYLESRFNVSP